MAFMYGGASWPDRIRLKVELILLLSYVVAAAVDHNEEERSCWLSAEGWELSVLPVVRSCWP